MAEKVMSTEPAPPPIRVRADAAYLEERTTKTYFPDLPSDSITEVSGTENFPEREGAPQVEKIDMGSLELAVT